MPSKVLISPRLDTMSTFSAALPSELPRFTLIIVAAVIGPLIKVSLLRVALIASSKSNGQYTGISLSDWMDSGVRNRIRKDKEMDR